MINTLNTSLNNEKKKKIIDDENEQTTKIIYKKNMIIYFITTLYSEYDMLALDQIRHIHTLTAR